MKFSDYYFSNGARVLSVIVGVLSGAIVGFVCGVWQYGVLSGAITTLLASVLLPIRFYRQDLPYIKIKETMKRPFLVDERVRFTVQGGSVGGFLILTDDSMVFLSLERGDHRLELSRADVASVICGRDMTMSIFLNNKQYIRVISDVCAEICDVLRENGWSVSSGQ